MALLCSAFALGATPAAGAGGTVTLKGRFAVDGTVAEVKIVYSEPTGKFDALALRSLKSWRVKPWWAKGAKQGYEFSKTLNFYDDLALTATAVPEVQQPLEAEDDSSWSQDLKLVRTGWLRWPNAALAPIRGGWMRVQGTVGTDGHVRDAVVIEAHPPGLFDETVLRAVRTWKFERRDKAPIAEPHGFSQRFWFDAGVTTFEMMQAQYLVVERAKARQLLVDLATLCPSAYPHAADELNSALEHATRKHPLPDGPVPELPETAPEAVALMLQYGECLFSSWEQLKDAKAYSAAARFGWFDQSIYWRGRFALCDRAIALGLDPDGCRQSLDLDDGDRLTARHWVAGQFAEGYQMLISQRTAQRGDKLTLSPEAQQALAAARKARAEGGRTEPVGVLTRALRRATTADDVAVLRLTLARVLMDTGSVPDAREELEKIIQAGTPWYAVQMARVMRCVAGEDYYYLRRWGDEAMADFDANVATLNAELGVGDRLTF